MKQTNNFQQALQHAQHVIQQRIQAAEPNEANAQRAAAWVKWINRHVLQESNPRHTHKKAVQSC